MNLDLTDDQRMLKDSVDRLIAEQYSFEQRTQRALSAEGWSRETWQQFAELGLLMLRFDEPDGGLGLSGVETMIVGEAFGRGLVVEPYLSSTILAGTALRLGGTPAQKAEWLPRVMDGSRLAAFVEGEPLQLHNGSLSGTAPMVLGGGSADVLVVAAEEGCFLLPADAAGIDRRRFRLHGGGEGAEIRFDQVSVAGAQLSEAKAIPTRVREAGIAWLAAEATGAMQAALDMTVEHLRTREQFGKPIGANQALQHRAAEMLVALEQARSAALLAATLDKESDAETRARGFAAVKIVIGKAARVVGQQAVQLHGGIGVSEEYAIGHYFKRLAAIEMLLGDTEHHVHRLAELGGFTGVAGHWDAR